MCVCVGGEAFKAAGVFQTFERFKCNYVFDSQSLPHTMCKIFKMVQTVFKVLKHTSPIFDCVTPVSVSLAQLLL